MKGIYLPKKKSKELVVFIPGWSGKVKDYTKFLLKPISTEYNVLGLNLPKLGNTSLERCILEISEKLNDNFDKVFYLTHSMGTQVAVAMENKMKNKMDALYAINGFPGFLGCYGLDIELPLAPFKKLKKYNINCPARFAIAEDDEVIRTKNNKLKLIDFFSNNGELKFFENKYHCFNDAKYDYEPFNKDRSDILIKDILEFYKRIK